MRLRTGVAALTIGAAAAVTPLMGVPTAGAAPASGESTATEAGQELTYFGWFYNQSACVETGWAGYQYGMWHADWICWNNGGYWELWVNPAFS